jgi:ankyrin repeat protein
LLYDLVAAFARHLGIRAQYGYTALIRAAWAGRANCVRLLLDAGADKEAKNEVRSVRPCLQRVACFGGGKWLIGVDGNRPCEFLF